MQISGEVESFSVMEVADAVRLVFESFDSRLLFRVLVEVIVDTQDYVVYWGLILYFVREVLDGAWDASMVRVLD